MSQPLLPAWSGVRTPVVGMLHIPPLPGAPRFGGDLESVRRHVLQDAEALVDGGVHGLLLENFGDAPFYPDRVPAHVVTHMTAIADEVRRRFDVPLGINVLRNDGLSALAIAHVVGASFIRVNVLRSARLTDQGLIQGSAHELLRARVQWGANAVKILADVNVKHSVPLGPPRSIEDEVADTLARGGADAVIVSGGATGQPTDVEELKRAKRAAGAAPVFVGSGVTPENIANYVPFANGFIVGTAFKQDVVATSSVDAARVQALMSRLR